MVQKMMPMERFLLTFMVQALFDLGVHYGEVGKKPNPKNNERTEKKRKIFLKLFIIGEASKPVIN